jgi:hypothetical protein
MNIGALYDLAHFSGALHAYRAATDKRSAMLTDSLFYLYVGIPEDGDHWFRRDRNQLSRSPERWSPCAGMISTEGVALDITEGQLISEGNLGESQRANQEIAHAQDQGSTTFKIWAGAGSTGDRPSLFDQEGAVNANRALVISTWSE